MTFMFISGLLSSSLSQICSCSSIRSALLYGRCLICCYISSFGKLNLFLSSFCFISITFFHHFIPDVQFFLYLSYFYVSCDVIFYAVKEIIFSVFMLLPMQRPCTFQAILFFSSAIFYWCPN